MWSRIFCLSMNLYLSLYLQNNVINCECSKLFNNYITDRLLIIQDQRIDVVPLQKFQEVDTKQCSFVLFGECQFIFDKPLPETKLFWRYYQCTNASVMVLSTSYPVANLSCLVIFLFLITFNIIIHLTSTPTPARPEYVIS